MGAMAKADLVDKPDVEELAIYVGAADDHHVPFAGRLPSLGHGGLDPLGDEDVARAALLDDRFRGPVGDDEARRVVRRLLAPGSDAEVGLAPADDQGAPTLVK
jgi:hypothetical protein